MATALDVATWMVEQFGEKPWLYQDVVAWKMKKEYGSPFTYDNENGNVAIAKEVLKHFRDLTEGKVVWDKGEKAWRKLRDGEKYKGRQIE